MSITLGDVVCHKSGGPAMTVEHIGVRDTQWKGKPLGLDSAEAMRVTRQVGDERTVWCVWFVEVNGHWQGPFREGFDRDALKITQPGDRTTALFEHVREISNRNNWPLRFDMTNQWIEEIDA